MSNGRCTLRAIVFRGAVQEGRCTASLRSRATDAYGCSKSRAAPKGVAALLRQPGQAPAAGLTAKQRGEEGRGDSCGAPSPCPPTTGYRSILKSAQEGGLLWRTSRRHCLQGRWSFPEARSQGGASPGCGIRTTPSYDYRGAVRRQGWDGTASAARLCQCAAGEEARQNESA